MRLGQAGGLGRSGLKTGGGRDGVGGRVGGSKTAPRAVTACEQWCRSSLPVSRVRASYPGLF